MASITVQHEVKDFTAWKKAFDSNIDMRTSSGELSSQLYRDATYPNKVTVISKWDSMENAQKFAHSPELKAALEKAGVMGTPTINFLNEA